MVVQIFISAFDVRTFESVGPRRYHIHLTAIVTHSNISATGYTIGV